MLLFAVVACGGDEPDPAAREAVARREALERTTTRAADLIRAAHRHAGRDEIADAWKAWREARELVGETPEVADAARSIRVIERRIRAGEEYQALLELAQTEADPEDEPARLKLLARVEADATSFLSAHPEFENRAEIEEIRDYAARELGLARDYARAIERAEAGEAAGRWKEMAAAAKEALAVFDREEARALLARARAALTPEGMVFVPGGRFRAGPDGAPAVVAAFYIDRCEVTNEEYARFCRDTGHETPEPFLDGKPPAGKEKNPVTYVTLDDALAFAKWAGKRLPTEREWERAARGTDGRAYPWGNEWDPAKGHFGGGGTRPVGTTPLDLSPVGCLDMGGNVMEMTLSVADPEGRDPEGRDPKVGPVMKGGHWSDDFHPEYALTWSRWEVDRNHADSGSGFRCAVRVP